MKSALLAVSLSLLSSNARAAVVFYELDPEIRAKTNELLAEKNLNYRELAQNSLKGTGHFDRQRVEITGMLAADDTRRIDPGDFDDYIKPSVNADKKRTIGDWVWSRGGYKPDVEEMEKSMRGEMTEHTIKTVAPYKDMEINEIVAHSWGSELIYAAILNGEMRPPKRLIVLGVPDDDRAKWSLLAERTGTEVFWGRADNDAAALDKGVKLAKEAAKGVDFKAKWDAACAAKDKRICLPHGRRPKPVVIIPVGNLPARPPLFLAHDRADYYDRVRKDFFRGTAHQLKAADNKLVGREMAKLEEETVATTHAAARELVEAARAQALIARRDHDERLKNTYIDLARRFCAAHGGVSQAELDALPKPYGREIVYDDPPGLQGCEATIYSAISRGVKADALIYQIPVPVQGVRPSPPVAIIPRIHFSSNLTDLSDLSKRACSSAGRIEGAERLANPLNPYFFRREIDDEKIEELSARLDDCSRRLFNELVEMIRAGQGAAVTSRWLRDRANDYSSRPIYAAPSGDAPRRSGQCEDYGNVRCP